MNKKISRLVALLLVLVMLTAVLAGCKKETSSTETDESKSPTDTTAPSDDTGGDTLVVATADFSAKFSPFFYTTVYDGYIGSDMTQLSLLGIDREGNVITEGIEGQVVPFNGTDYTYYGIANCEITENDDGTVDYKITMRDDIKFSDGEPMNIDDAIFSIYVISDPTYDGSSTFYALPIEGMEDYRAGMDTLTNIILAAGPDAVSEFSNEEQTAYFWDAFQVAGEKFCQSIADYVIANYGAEDFASAVALWGYEANDPAEMWDQMIANYGYDISDEGINLEVADTSIGDFLAEALGDRASEFAAGVQVGEGADYISGIERLDDYSMNIHMTEVDATAIYSVGTVVAPLHYYGDKDAYDYDAHNFGFPKGDLSSIRAKNSAPLGAGPYKFVSYENGTVTMERNEYYFKGAPKITYVLFKETSSADMLTGISTGTYDLTADASYNTSAADTIRGYNSNGETTGDVYTTISIDNLGYGYIGINADLVKVGGEKDSDASKALRKAFATMFAVYRDTAIDSYYGELATVINYPISNTSWAAPKPADEGYEVAFSKDVDGNPIYTADMDDEAKYDAALQAAIGFFKAAGYTWDDAAGKFTAAPEGASMKYTVVIPADGTGDHPSYGILTNAKEALATIGIELEVNDVADGNILWDGLDANTIEMWAAAWGATVDPDMYQVYHSDNVSGQGTGSNHYYIQDAELDQLIVDARSSVDQAYRKAAYKDCLDLIIDWACEVPVYQRQNASLFSTERVNCETITPDMTPFWGWMNDIELLEMN